MVGMEPEIGHHKCSLKALRAFPIAELYSQGTREAAIVVEVQHSIVEAAHTSADAVPLELSVDGNLLDTLAVVARIEDAKMDRNRMSPRRERRSAEDSNVRTFSIDQDPS